MRSADSPPAGTYGPWVDLPPHQVPARAREAGPDGDPAHWQVWTAGGRRLRVKPSATHPVPDLPVVARGDRVIGVVRDSLGRESVLVSRLRGTDPG